jgi:hypothetical protein
MRRRRKNGKEGVPKAFLFTIEMMYIFPKSSPGPLIIFLVLPPGGAIASYFPHADLSDYGNNKCSPRKFGQTLKIYK